jgi:hypothetical protein
MKPTMGIELDLRVETVEYLQASPASDGGERVRSRRAHVLLSPG